MTSTAPLTLDAIVEKLRTTRRLTEALAATLAPEDQMIQSMPDVSPTQWHRAHTTWFFEAFVLGPHAPGYRPVHPTYDYLFNSYYEQVGDRHPRHERGLISRPTCDEVAEYRAAVDRSLAELVDGADQDRLDIITPLLELGTHHEQQHQELLLMDIKHAFSCSPLRPVFRLGTAAVSGPRVDVNALFRIFSRTVLTLTGVFRGPVVSTGKTASPLTSRSERRASKGTWEFRLRSWTAQARNAGS